MKGMLIERPAAAAHVFLPWLFFLLAPLAHAQSTDGCDPGVAPTSQVRAKHKVSNLTFRPGGPTEAAAVAEMDVEDEVERGTSRRAQAGDSGP